MCLKGPAAGSQKRVEGRTGGWGGGSDLEGGSGKKQGCGQKKEGGSTLGFAIKKGHRGNKWST